MGCAQSSEQTEKEVINETVWDEADAPLAKSNTVDVNADPQAVRFREESKELIPRCLGIQMNLQNEHLAKYYPLLQQCCNNLGDPYTARTAYVNTFKHEVQLIHLLAEQIWKIPYEKVWGYITHGSSESNLHGLYVGRRWLEKSNEGKRIKIHVLHASDSHYSITKACDILKMTPASVGIDNEGRMDVALLDEVVRQILLTYTSTPEADGLPCFLLVACSGSVRAGAMDNVDALAEKLKAAVTLDPTRVFIHLDAALGGFVTPFLSEPEIEGREYYRTLNISNKNVHSQSASFHKRIGVPFPCSVFMAKRDMLSDLQPPQSCGCLGTLDTTLAGSRNGISAFIILNEMSKPDFQRDMIDRTTNCMRLADYVISESLKRIKGECPAEGVNWKEVFDFVPFRPKGMMCVVMPSPPESLQNTFRLAFFDGQKVLGGGESRHAHVHIFTMEHVTEQGIDQYFAAWAAALRSGEKKGLKAYASPDKDTAVYKGDRRASDPALHIPSPLISPKI